MSEKKAKILLVDDEEIILDSLSAWLEEEDFSLLTAENGFKALELMENNTVDAAVIDIKMPGMDGLTLLKEIRKTNESLPIIMITAHVSVESAVQSMKDGAYDYIMKPFPPEKLSNILKNVIEHQKTVEKLEKLRGNWSALHVCIDKLLTYKNLHDISDKTKPDLDKAIKSVIECFKLLDTDIQSL